MQIVGEVAAAPANQTEERRLHCICKRIHKITFKVCMPSLVTFHPFFFLSLFSPFHFYPFIFLLSSHFPLTGFHQISSFLLGRAIQEFKKQGETFILRRLPENGVWHLRLLRKKGADSRSIPTYLRIRQRSLRSRTSRRFVGKAGKKGRKEGEEGRGGRKKGRKASLSLPSFSLFFYLNFRLTLIRTLIRTSDWRKLICLRRMNSLTS